MLELVVWLLSRTSLLYEDMIEVPVLIPPTEMSSLNNIASVGLSIPN